MCQMPQRILLTPAQLLNHSCAAGQAVSLRAEESMMNPTRTTDAQAVSINIPPMPSSGVLSLDFVVNGVLCSSKVSPASSIQTPVHGTWRDLHARQ